MTDSSLLDPRLQQRYRDASGGVAFVDESYWANAGPGQRAFYSMSAVTFDVGELDEIRRRLVEIAGRRFWHTTEAYSEGNTAGVARMGEFLAERAVWNVVTVDLPLGPRAGEVDQARATCLAALSREVTRGTGPDAVRLIVADNNKDQQLNRADQRVLAMLRSVGDVHVDASLYHARMTHEPVLWAADVVSWSAYRALSVDDGRWIAPLRDVMTVLDARTGLAVEMKQPQAAVARGAVAPRPGAQQSTPHQGPQTAVASEISLSGVPDTVPAFTRGSTVIDDLARRVKLLRIDAGSTGVSEGNTPRALASRVAAVRRRPPTHGVDDVPAAPGPAPQV